MTVKEARVAIEAILAAIPDDELPQFDRVEIDNDRGETVVWWGGQGRVLGSARRGAERRPITYRESASWEAIQHEMTYRADLRFLENGDTAEGISLGTKTVAL